jgi:hypothetical protein
MGVVSWTTRPAFVATVLMALMALGALADLWRRLTGRRESLPLEAPDRRG